MFDLKTYSLLKSWHNHSDYYDQIRNMLPCLNYLFTVFIVKIDKANATLKEHLLQLHPQLEELRNKKDERLKQFEKVK